MYCCCVSYFSFKRRLPDSDITYYHLPVVEFGMLYVYYYCFLVALSCDAACLSFWYVRVDHCCHDDVLFSVCISQILGFDGSSVVLFYERRGAELSAPSHRALENDAGARQPSRSAALGIDLVPLSPCHQHPKPS